MQAKYISVKMLFGIKGEIAHNSLLAKP